jgi:hypothetical protein
VRAYARAHLLRLSGSWIVDCVWNVIAHAQKPDFVFRRNGRVHLNRRGLRFSRLQAAEVCASAVVMLDAPCSEVVWRVLATHSIRQFPLHFPTRASPCAITFHLDSTCVYCVLYCLYCVFCIVSFMYIYSCLFCLYWCKDYCHPLTTNCSNNNNNNLYNLSHISCIIITVVH